MRHAVQDHRLVHSVTVPSPSRRGTRTQERDGQRESIPSGNESAEARGRLQRRLAVVRDRVRGVALGLHNGLYLYGRPGTGKTYTVRSTLEELAVRYCYQLGHLTPLGLFELLADNRDQVIVLDDISALLEQRVALQILLGALGNQPGRDIGRVVKYRRQGRLEVVTFHGQIICISNLALQRGALLTALKSRVHYLGFEPADDEIIALLRDLAASGWPAKNPLLSPEECQQVAAFVIEEATRRGVALDLRQLLDKAYPDYLQHRSGNTEVDWRDLVIASLEEQVVDLRHTATIRPTNRKEQKESEQELVRSLLADFPRRSAQLEAWEQQTAKSERAFYRRLEERGLDSGTSR